MKSSNDAKRWLFVIVAWVVINLVATLIDYVLVEKLGSRTTSVTAPAIVCIFLLNDWYRRNRE